MSEIPITKLEPAEQFLLAKPEGNGWIWNEEGLLQKVGSAPAVFLGNRALQGGIHAFSFRVTAYGVADIEIGAAETSKSPVVIRDIMENPDTIRYTRIVAKDGDQIRLLLDLMQGYVLVQLNGTLVRYGREDGLARVYNRILDQGFVSPLILVRSAYQLALTIADSGEVPYDVRMSQDFVADVLANRRRLQEELADQFQTPRSVHVVPREVLEGQRHFEMNCFVGDQVQFNMYENVVMDWFWEFESSPNDESVLVREINPEKDVNEAYSYWGHAGMTTRANFLCRAPGSEQIYFACVKQGDIDRGLDNSILVKVSEPTPEDDSYWAYCKVS
ncbi:hypothetical protein NDN08_005768 [Rhodosorus marinus]|uniref:Uncharacterized protein n=1 Tax=Rhodosorus marinus TaxID=101924 RepID=A0AAV8V5I0_9RHOD|nr:hypothetical protein NDN08_005768 [Rhodosorus marinus]